MDQQEIETEDKPLDPAVDKVRKKLVRFMAVNLLILSLALMAVVLAVVYRWTRTPETSQPAPSVIAENQGTVPTGAELVSTIPLEPGTKVLSQALSGSRVSLETVKPGGERVLVIYDYFEARIIARVNLPSN